jgi:hypothetical protein
MLTRLYKNARTRDTHAFKHTYKHSWDKHTCTEYTPQTQSHVLCLVPQTLTHTHTHTHTHVHTTHTQRTHKFFRTKMCMFTQDTAAQERSPAQLSAAAEAEAWLGSLLLSGRGSSGLAPFARLAGSPSAADVTHQAKRWGTWLQKWCMCVYVCVRVCVCV